MKTAEGSIIFSGAGAGKKNYVNLNDCVSFLKQFPKGYAPEISALEINDGALPSTIIKIHESGFELLREGSFAIHKLDRSISKITKS